jgi:hypothetical protein
MLTSIRLLSFNWLNDCSTPSMILIAAGLELILLATGTSNT